jgi:hypothetical protein
VRANKSLSGVEHAFHSLKTVNLELRPGHSRETSDGHPDRGISEQRLSLSQLESVH